MGLPLHLWSQSAFKTIGDSCSGWMETEEETSLCNHLKWATIRVYDDGPSIPREISIENGGLLFSMLIWVESLARYKAKVMALPDGYRGL